MIAVGPINVLYTYLSSRVPVPWSSDFRAIGWVEDGALKAVTGYNGFHGNTCQIHIAAEGKYWMRRAHLWTTFNYPFNQLGLTWLIGVVGSNNAAALKMDKNLGFEEFARIPEGYSLDEDIILLRMHRESVRAKKWLSLGERYGWESKAAASA